VKVGVCNGGFNNWLLM